MTTDDSNPFGLTLYVFRFSDGDESEYLLTGDPEASHLGRGTGAVSVINVVSGENILGLGQVAPSDPSSHTTGRSD